MKYVSKHKFIFRKYFKAQIIVSSLFFLKEARAVAELPFYLTRD